MDITLERILSLLPRKPDGRFIHGSKKEFAQKIGYDSGDIVSMWISGDSASYKKKLHEISAVYNVSVEWLKGETDEKKPTTGIGDGLSETQKEAIELIKSLSDEQLRYFVSFGKSMLGKQED